MSNKTLLQYHKEWMKKGQLPNDGLCCTLYNINEHLYYKFKEHFEPTPADINELEISRLSTGYWGSGLDVCDNDKVRKYTELRQTLMCLLIAITNTK